MRIGHNRPHAKDTSFGGPVGILKIKKKFFANPIANVAANVEGGLNGLEKGYEETGK